MRSVVLYCPSESPSSDWLCGLSLPTIGTLLKLLGKCFILHLRFRSNWLNFFLNHLSFYSKEIKEVLELGEATIEFMPHGDQATKPELLERFTVGEPPKEEGESEEEVEQPESA
jgi:hypothetical protein